MPCAPSSVLVTTSSKAAPSSVRSLLVDALIVADLYLDAFALSSNGVLDHGLLPWSAGLRIRRSTCLQFFTKFLPLFFSIRINRFRKWVFFRSPSSSPRILRLHHRTFAKLVQVSLQREEVITVNHHHSLLGHPVLAKLAIRENNYHENEYFFCKKSKSF